MSRHNRSIGWQPIHYAYAQKKTVHIQLQDGGFIVGPVWSIGDEPDQFEIGTKDVRFWVQWSSVRAVYVVQGSAFPA